MKWGQTNVTYCDKLKMSKHFWYSFYQDVPLSWIWVGSGISLTKRIREQGNYAIFCIWALRNRQFPFTVSWNNLSGSFLLPCQMSKHPDRIMLEWSGVDIAVNSPEKALPSGHLSQGIRHMSEASTFYISSLGCWITTVDLSQWYMQKKNHATEFLPTKSWYLINSSCFKLLNFGIICHAAVSNWNTCFKKY